MNIDLENVHKEIKKILYRVNGILIRSFNGETLIRSQDGVDLTSFVTKADEKVGRLLEKELSTRFPEIGFVNEYEDNKNKTSLIKPKYNWIIDPIDGTLNFANKIPLFAVSIALWEKNKPIYSIVSLPMQGDIIHAINGKGAFLNGKLIKKENQKLARPYIVYAHATDSVSDKLKLYKYLLKKDPFPRFLGSGVYQTTMTCLRRADYAIFVNTAIWDIAATILITKESGLHAEFISPYPDILENIPDLRKYCHSVVIGEKETVIKIAQDIKKLDL